MYRIAEQIVAIMPDYVMIVLSTPNIYIEIIHVLFHISLGIIPRPPYQPETQSRDDSRDDMQNVMY